MHRLHSEETLSIRPHFDTPNLRLVVDSIIDGKTPARAWADDLAAPKTVLAWEGRCIYLVGDFEGAKVNKGLREIFSTEIQPEGQSRKLGFFKLYYSPDAWSLRLEEIFGSLSDNDVERRIYCSVRDSSARVAVPSPPLELRQIDAQLLQSDFAHIGLVRDEILGCWTSFETFLDQGFGFAMLDGTSVVCWCTAEYVSEGKCGIGIETIEAYQRRGIATVVTGEFVRHALASGVNPHWDCWASNTPSVRVAEKVGFADKHDYKIAIGTFGDG